VVVTFDHPEKFTDLKTSMTGTDRDRMGLMEDLRDFLADEARRYLTAGQTLKVTFTDVYMAGDFEPWRGASTQNVRILRDIYPPRISLDFALVNADGSVASSGSRRLTDLMYLSTLSVGVFRDDRLRYEKGLLGNWLASEFGARRR
jgi:hypothetical protein